MLVVLSIIYYLLFIIYYLLSPYLITANQIVYLNHVGRGFPVGIVSILDLGTADASELVVEIVGTSRLTFLATDSGLCIVDVTRASDSF